MPGSKALLIALGLGAAACLYRRATAKTGLEGIDKSQKGANGSPFYTECTVDKFQLYFALKHGEEGDKAMRHATSCKWACADHREVRVARFRDRTDPDNVAYLARSPKPEGGWQVSWVDKEGPRGDVPRRTQCEAVAILSSGYRGYGKVSMVEGEPMSNWYLEEWQ